MTGEMLQVGELLLVPVRTSQDAEGQFIATCPTWPGVRGVGSSMEVAKARLRRILEDCIAMHVPPTLDTAAP